MTDQISVNQFIPVKNISYLNQLTEQEIQAIEDECVHFELRSAAAIESLKIVQANHGWVSDDKLKAIAELLQMSATELDGVATFYNHIYRHPVGHYVIHLCDSISCWLNGYPKIQSSLEQELGIAMGQTTPDDLFTLLPNACLGGCDKAPVLMVNGDYVENLSVEQIPDLIRKLKERASG